MSRGLLKTAGGGRVANGLVVVNERCSISMSDGDRQRAMAQCYQCCLLFERRSPQTLGICCHLRRLADVVCPTICFRPRPTILHDQPPKRTPCGFLAACSAISASVPSASKLSAKPALEPSDLWFLLRQQMWVLSEAQKNHRGC